MQRFGYTRAASIAEAVALLSQENERCVPLAGGTDLLIQIRANPAYCDRVVDISRIPELRRIERQGDEILVGAAVSFHEIILNPVLQECAPVLTQACRQIGAAQIRNMGTLGGNVANAAACADSLPALACLDARVEIATGQGRLEMPISEFILGPNRTKNPRGGLLTGLRFAVAHPGNRAAFIKLGRRNAMAISRLTVAAMGRLDDAGAITEARVAPGSATPTIGRFASVESCLLGQRPSLELFQHAGDLAVREMARISGRRWSSEYKEPALTAMMVQALDRVFTDGNAAHPEEVR